MLLIKLTECSKEYDLEMRLPQNFCLFILTPLFIHTYLFIPIPKSKCVTFFQYMLAVITKSQWRSVGRIHPPPFLGI